MDVYADIVCIWMSNSLADEMRLPWKKIKKEESCEYGQNGDTFRELFKFLKEEMSSLEQ